VFINRITKFVSFNLERGDKLAINGERQHAGTQAVGRERTLTDPKDRVPGKWLEWPLNSGSADAKIQVRLLGNSCSSFGVRPEVWALASDGARSKKWTAVARRTGGNRWYTCWDR